MSTTRYANGSQLRLMALIEILAGHEVAGLRLKEIAAALDTVMPTALRDLQTMAQKGWAEQKDDGAWRLGAKPVQIAIHFTHGLKTAKDAVAEVEQRYTRIPK